MVNRVQLIGHVGQSPEIRHLENGNCVANFSLATSEKWKDKAGNQKEETEWHRIVIWGKLAEIVEKYVKKGGLLYLEGKNRTRSWEKEGQKMYTTEVVCDEIRMLGSKSDNHSNASDGTTINQADHVPDNEQDDLPF